MSGTINSSGSVERFTLAASEQKDFEVLKPGGTQWLIDVHGDEDQDMQGNLQAVGTTVELQTSEDGTTYTTVGSAVTVVPGGSTTIAGATGRFARIKNTGTGPTHVVAKPSFRVQAKLAL